MSEFLAGAYPTLKALHIIAVIAWMAGLLYLPRLFVYHCAAKPGGEASETFKVMERRLFRGIMNPAMIAVWIFGPALAFAPQSGGWSQPWLHTKLLLVIALTVLHHMMGRWRKAFERDANVRTARFFRIMNEVPTVLLVAIVFLVVLKPFG